MVDKKKCPFCNELNELEDKFCIYCGKKLPISKDDDFAKGVCCLNCGKPVKEGQTKCECGYELAEIKCPHCSTYNLYTNNYCTSCGTRLWSSYAIFSQTKPHGCDYGENNEILLDTEFLKQELLKNPYQIDNKIHTQTLRSEYLKHDAIINEICSRWWIVSPFNCKSCLGKIDPQKDSCPTCNIAHHSNQFDERVKELKTLENNYVEINRDINELSDLKWTYKVDDSDMNDYLNFLAPMIGESQAEYRKRLFKEWWENSAIAAIIKNEWNIYFENICMNCGDEFQPYDLHCPSCGMEKDVPALGVLLNDDYVEKARFSHQYHAFSKNVKNICRTNGGNIDYIDYGIAGCPGCSNYFHYLTPDFIDTHRCPHCGAEFEITANIYENESDLVKASKRERGLTEDEIREGMLENDILETFYGIKW